MSVGNALGEMPSTEGLLGPSCQDPAQRAAAANLLTLGSEHRALRSRRRSASWGARCAPSWLPGGPTLGVGFPAVGSGGSVCFSSSPHLHTASQAQVRVPPRGPVRWICLVGTLWFISSCLGASAVLLGTHLATLGSLQRAADTSPTPWRWSNCLINSKNLGEGHLNAPLVQTDSKDHSNDLTRKGSDFPESAVFLMCCLSDFIRLQC